MLKGGGGDASIRDGNEWRGGGVCKAPRRVVNPIKWSELPVVRGDFCTSAREICTEFAQNTSLHRQTQRQGLKVARGGGGGRIKKREKKTG